MLYKDTITSSNLKESFDLDGKGNSLQGEKKNTSSNVSSCPSSLQGEKFVQIGRRRLRVVEFYGERSIDEIIPVFVKVIFPIFKDRTKREGESI